MDDLFEKRALPLLLPPPLTPPHSELGWGDTGHSLSQCPLEACPETNKAKNTTTQNDAEANLSKFKQI